MRAAAAATSTEPSTGRVTTAIAPRVWKSASPAKANLSEPDLVTLTDFDPEISQRHQFRRLERIKRFATLYLESDRFGRPAICSDLHDLPLCADPVSAAICVFGKVRGTSID